MDSKAIMLKWFQTWPDLGFGVHADYFSTKFVEYLKKENLTIVEKEPLSNYKPHVLEAVIAKAKENGVI